MPWLSLLASHHGVPGLCAGQCKLDLWWKKWHWDGSFCVFFGFSCHYYSTIALHTHILSRARMTNWWPTGCMWPAVRCLKCGYVRLGICWVNELSWVFCNLNVNYPPTMFSLALLMWYWWKRLIFNCFYSFFLLTAYKILDCNFLLINFNCLAIYVISGQKGTNGHFMDV
jgi:hypothetical protein